MTNAGLVFLKTWEELRLTAYLDVAGIPTIGYGSLRYLDGTKVKLGDTIDEPMADLLLLRECAVVELDVDAMVLPTLKPCQMDALVSFCYNIGRTAFRSSTLRKFINAEVGCEAITAQFLRWNKAKIDGTLKPVAGLTRRRRAEAAMFCSEET